MEEASRKRANYKIKGNQIIKLYLDGSVNNRVAKEVANGRDADH